MGIGFIQGFRDGPHSVLMEDPCPLGHSSCGAVQGSSNQAIPVVANQLQPLQYSCPGYDATLFLQVQGSYHQTIAVCDFTQEFYLRISMKRGLQNRPQYAMITFRRTPKKSP